jgi:hypothetical protein
MPDSVQQQVQPKVCTSLVPSNWAVTGTGQPPSLPAVCGLPLPPRRLVPRPVSISSSTTSRSRTVQVRGLGVCSGWGCKQLSGATCAAAPLLAPLTRAALLLLLLQVCAKGKGGRMRAPMAPGGEMVSAVSLSLCVRHTLR